jgi:hypothetical protein
MLYQFKSGNPGFDTCALVTFPTFRIRIFRLQKVYEMMQRSKRALEISAIRLQFKCLTEFHLPDHLPVEVGQQLRQGPLGSHESRSKNLFYFRGKKLFAVGLDSLRLTDIC